MVDGHRSIDQGDLQLCCAPVRGINGMSFTRYRGSINFPLLMAAREELVKNSAFCFRFLERESNRKVPARPGWFSLRFFS